MKKFTIYPKTPRVEQQKKLYQVTEKLDGSNLGLLKHENTLYIFQRNYCYTLTEINEIKDKMYKGLYAWLTVYKDELLSSLKKDTIIFGEWIGQGHIKYDTSVRFYVFARAKLIDIEDFQIDRCCYSWEFLKYAFENARYPFFIQPIPFVDYITSVDKNSLNNLYDTYTKRKERQVEGFVIKSNYGEKVQKYVRYKNGKPTKHFD